MQLDGHVIRAAVADDEAAAQTLFEADPNYFEIVEGAPAGSAEFQNTITELAPGKSYEDKFVFCVLNTDGNVVAVIDILRDYPEDGIWFVGLVFVAREQRGQGLGSRLVEAICTHVAMQGGNAARIAVADKNTDAMRFWERAGFAALYSAKRERAQSTPLLLHVMERAL
jgi:GNAT superfamily N-acetyltransferase